MTASTSTTRISWPRTIGRILVGAIVVGGVAAAVALVLYPPTGYIRQAVTTAVQKATGRTFTFAGDPVISFTPRPKITLQRVALAGPANLPGPETLRAETVEAEIDPMALLRGRLSLANVTLSRAAITLRPDDSTMAAPAGGAAGVPAAPLPFSEVRIVDSAVNYLITHPNPAWRVDQVSAVVSGLDSGGPLKAQGKLRWRGEMVDIDGTIGSLSGLASAEGAPLKVTAIGRRVTASLDGRLAPKAPSILSGALSAKLESARDVLRWLGDMDFGPYALSGPASLDGVVGVSQGEAKIEKATLKLEAGQGTWDVRFAFGGAKPKIDGTIAWQEVDLLKLMGEEPVPMAAAAALEARAATQGPVIESAWDSLSDTLKAVESAASGTALPALRNAEKTTGWSTTPFDLQALSAADVDLTSTATVLKYGRIDLRNSQTHLGIKDGRLAYTVKQVEIGSGKADGRLELDGTSKAAKVTVGMRASDVPAETVLAQLFKSRLVSGATKLDVGIEGSGRTAQEIIASLAGKADLAVANGAFHGFDLRRSLLNWWRPQKFDPSAQTRVQTISGQFALKDGVLRTNGPLTVDGDVKLSAEGSVEISRRSLDQNVRVRVAPPPEYIAIPVRVTGNWTQPKIAWDWKSVFESNGVLGSPFGLVPPGEPMPAEVKEQIARLLAGPAAQGLGPETRQVLERIGASP